VKDPLNYFYQYYNFDSYHAALEETLELLELKGLSLPFDERYEIGLQYDQNNDGWKLRSLKADYHTPVPQADIPAIYKHWQSMENRQQTDRSLAKRFLDGRGDSQPVNITL
jgi:hypothetical protein